jgi:hypothetical protein
MPSSPFGAAATQDGTERRVSKCPFGKLKAMLLSAKHVDFRAQTDRACPAQRTVLSWIRDFVVKPHPELGRGGSVCPFLPRALREDSVLFQTVHSKDLSADQLDELVQQYASVFLTTEPTSGKARLNKTIVLVFADVADDDAFEKIELTQKRLKPYFVERGLMLGEFHKTHAAAGIHNPNFRPLQSPVPLLVIRYMVPSDLPFLTKPSDPLTMRVRFLRSYRQLFRAESHVRERA